MELPADFLSLGRGSVTINHLLGFLNNRCTNTRISEQKSENLASVNSVFVAANQRVAFLAILLLRCEAAHAAAKSFVTTWVPSLWRRSSTLVFPLRDFSSNILENPN